MSAWRTKGPWEPEWVRHAREAYWASHVRRRELEGRIGREESGWAWLMRVRRAGLPAMERA